MRFFHSSLRAECKTPFGCLMPEQVCTLTVLTEEQTPLFLELRREDGFRLSIPLSPCAEGSSCQFSLHTPGLYFYRFRALLRERDVSLGMGEDPFPEHLRENGAEWQISVVPEALKTPKWCQGEIMYQIFPDRFHKAPSPPPEGKLTPYRMHTSEKESPFTGPDSSGRWCNDFYGGNLAGIEEKLPYLASLGVRILYLNPIFLAFSNHRYDTCDYRRIDPLLGTDAEFRSLCQAAHQCGIRIILDGVFSHVGEDSVYFDAYCRFGGGAISDPNSPYREWFDFQHYPDSYTCWWGIRSLPCVKEMTPSFLRFLITDENSVISHWLMLGADGFRLDVADELPDEFLILLRAHMKKIKPDAFLIGEVWEDASNKIAYGVRRTYFTRPELDSVMNYPLRTFILSLLFGEIDARGFARGILTILDHYPQAVHHCLMNILSTHDTPRIRTVLTALPESERELALHAAFFLFFTLPGIPCIYYGDEIDMEGGDDPMNRAYFQWERTETSPTLPFLRKLAKIRMESDPLRRGTLRFCSIPGTLTWCRETEGETVCGQLLLNPSAAHEIGQQDALIAHCSKPPRKFDFSLWHFFS